MPILAWTLRMAKTAEKTNINRFLINYQSILYFPVLLFARMSWAHQSWVYNFGGVGQHSVSICIVYYVYIRTYGSIYDYRYIIFTVYSMYMYMY